MGEYTHRSPNAEYPPGVTVPPNKRPDGCTCGRCWYRDHVADVCEGAFRATVARVPHREQGIRKLRETGWVAVESTERKTLLCALVNADPSKAIMEQRGPYTRLRVPGEYEPRVVLSSWDWHGVWLRIQEANEKLCSDS